MEENRKKSWGAKVGCMGAAFLGMVLVFGLFCSGMLFPVLGQQSSFEGTVWKDFGVRVPASLRVAHAARLAYRDPSYFYDCDLAMSDVALFKKQIEDAITTRHYEASEEQVGNLRHMGPRPPAWFDGALLPDCQKLGVRMLENGKEGSMQGYWFYFSSSRGKVYVYWYAT